MLDESSCERCVWAVLDCSANTEPVRHDNGCWVRRNYELVACLLLRLAVLEGSTTVPC